MLSRDHEYSEDQSTIQTYCHRPSEICHTNSARNILRVPGVFNKSAKFANAETVCAQLPLDALCERTFWIIPRTKKIFFEYPFLKLYAHPGNFADIACRVLEQCSYCKSNGGGFSVHVNLDGFTVSAAERYSGLVSMFCRICEVRNTGYTEHITEMHLYNASAMVDNICRILMPLVPAEIKPKLRIHSKSESDDLLADLHRIPG